MMDLQKYTCGLMLIKKMKKLIVPCVRALNLNIMTAAYFWIFVGMDKYLERP